MRELELAAQDEWSIAGVSAQEFVALGFIVDVPDVPIGSHLNAEDVSVVWFQLCNSASTGEFLVEGDELLRVLNAARERDDVKASTYGRVLWHSHYIAVEPSDVDIRDFPGWLADYGMVYHAPTGTTTVYNGDGVISPIEAPTTDSLTTG